MVIKKRRKFSRMRGSHTHCTGHKKKKRGAGNRGGRGNAGRGKRAAQRSSWYTKRGIKYGRVGFTMHRTIKKPVTVNLSYVQTKLAQKEGIIDLHKIGIGKLLGSGKVTRKLEIKVKSFSKKAEEKVTSAGGKIHKIE